MIPFRSRFRLSRFGLHVLQQANQPVRLDRIAVILVAGGMGLRLWLTLHGWPGLDSDEAIIGIMGRHILYGGERPVFFYGQYYMGALEAYMASIAFWFLGASTLALRLAIGMLTLGFLVAMYFVGRAAFGRITGLLTLTFLAFGPAYGLLREQAAVGGYQETLLFGALLPLLVYARLRMPAPRPATRQAWLTCYTHYALIGLIIGLGIWSDELILVLAVVSLGVLMLAKPRELFGLASLVLLLGLLIGGFPFIAYNLGHGGQTFAELSGQQLAAVGSGSAAVIARVRLTLDQSQTTLAMAMPAVLGSPHVCVVPGSLYAGYVSYPAQAAILGGGKTCAAGNTFFSLVVLAIYVMAVWHVLLTLARTRSPGGWLTKISARMMFWNGPHDTSRHLSSASSVATMPAHISAKMWLRVLLVVVAFATIAEFVLTNHSVVTDRFVSARYLLPLYITLPVLFGTLWEWVASLIRPRWARETEEGSEISGDGRTNTDTARDQIAPLNKPPIRSHMALAAASAVLLVILLAFSALGAMETLATAASPNRFALPASPSDQHVIWELHMLGISRFYTDYWNCYTLAFESDEHLHCSLYQGSDRYPPYAALLRATAHPAYVLPLGAAEQTFQSTDALDLYRVGYIRVVFEQYAIYYLPGGQQNLR